MSAVPIGPADHAQQIAFAPVPAAGHVFRWLATGAAAFEAMLQSIERAEHSVALEFYICKPGTVSDRFRNALIAASRRGVHVQLLLDAFGSDAVAGGYWREFERCGGQLRWFNPMRLLRLTFRNHRKLLVTDRATAIVGGLNLADEYDGDGVTHGWRDVALQLQGPVVDALTGSFERMWALAPFDPARLRDFGRAHRRTDGDASAPALLLAGPGCRTVDLRRQLHADLRTASRVTVHAAYFLPSRELGRMLADVALRGDVRILMPANSDVPVAQLATWYAIRRIGCAAIRFFEYLPQMMHGKLLVIDDVVYIGSANLDVRSRLINYELVLRLPIPALADQARQMFEADLRHSRPATIATPTGWQKLRQRGAYWLLARLDPYVASRKLRMLQ
jgi:cardiolipin synthase